VAFDQFQFGPDALKYISDNVNIAAITSKAFKSAQCGTTQTVSDKGQINLKVQRVGNMSNLTGGSVDADYQAVSTVTASPLCNGCCTVTIKTVLGANISKFYNFINKGWFFDATTEPIYIYGQILIQRSETRTLCP
jgi:hypothetical protein